MKSRAGRPSTCPACPTSDVTVLARGTGRLSVVRHGVVQSKHSSQGGICREGDSGSPQRARMRGRKRKRQVTQCMSRRPLAIGRARQQMGFSKKKTRVRVVRQPLRAHVRSRCVQGREEQRPPVLTLGSDTKQIQNPLERKFDRLLVCVRAHHNCHSSNQREA